MGRQKREYRCEAKSLGGFVQQIAHGYVMHGYRFYVVGWLPERADPQRVDAKLIEKYGILPSGAARRTRRKQGWASEPSLRSSRAAVRAPCNQGATRDLLGPRSR